MLGISNKNDVLEFVNWLHDNDKINWINNNTDKLLEIFKTKNDKIIDYLLIDRRIRITSKLNDLMMENHNCLNQSSKKLLLIINKEKELKSINKKINMDLNKNQIKINKIKV